jgi:hypothetical protein
MTDSQVETELEIDQDNGRTKWHTISTLGEATIYLLWSVSADIGTIAD